MFVLFKDLCYNSFHFFFVNARKSMRGESIHKVSVYVFYVFFSVRLSYEGMSPVYEKAEIKL